MLSFIKKNLECELLSLRLLVLAQRMYCPLDCRVMRQMPPLILYFFSFLFLNIFLDDLQVKRFIQFSFVLLVVCHGFIEGRNHKSNQNSFFHINFPLVLNNLGMCSNVIYWVIFCNQTWIIEFFLSRSKRRSKI